MVMQKRLAVTLYVHCLHCFSLYIQGVMKEVLGTHAVTTSVIVVTTTADTMHRQQTLASNKTQMFCTRDFLIVCSQVW